MHATDLTELTLAEAAMCLGQSWAQTWRLALTGELDARKVRGRWLVTTTSVEKARERFALRDQSQMPIVR